MSINTAAEVFRVWVTNRASVYSNSSLTTGTDNTWSLWNGCQHSGSTGTAYLSTSVTAATDSVWLKWLHMWLHMPHSYIEHVRTAPPPPTPEQLAERARIQELARVAELERRAKLEAATKRARGLLMSHLTHEQRDSYERNGYFDVLVDGKTYRINQGTHGNVALVDGKGTIERYCAQPDGVPTEDAMLAQLLSLRFAPAEFFNKANRTRVRN